MHGLSDRQTLKRMRAVESAEMYLIDRTRRELAAATRTGARLQAVPAAIWGVSLVVVMGVLHWVSEADLLLRTNS